MFGAICKISNCCNILFLEGFYIYSRNYVQ